MKKLLILVGPLLVGLAFAGVMANTKAEATTDKVTICHYDRNDTGPNAGPHTIEVAASAVFSHLFNHTKNKGYVGDDSLGACPTPTATVTPSATNTASPTVTTTNTPTVTATNTPTDTPTSTASPSVTASPTSTNTPTPTESSTPTATYSPTETPSATDTSSPTPKASSTTEPSSTPSPTDTPFVSIPETGTPVFIPVTSLPDTGSGEGDHSTTKQVTSWAVIIFFLAVVAGCLASLHDEFFPPKKDE